MQQIIEEINKLVNIMEERFDRIDKRFDSLEASFDKLLDREEDFHVLLKKIEKNTRIKD